MEFVEGLMTRWTGLFVLGLIALVGLGLVAMGKLGVALPWGGSGSGSESLELVLQADGADPRAARAGMDKALEEARATIARRVEELGAREASVSREGADRLHVKVDGIKDASAARALILAPGRFEFRLVDLAATSEQIRSDRAPVGSEILAYSGEGGRGPERMAVQRRAVVPSGMMKDARQVFGQDGNPVVAITLTDEGARRLAGVTSENVGKPLAFLLDDVVLSAPVINEPITGGMAQINGGFTVESANDLAILIASGPLPIKLRVVEEKVPARAPHD